MAGFSVTCKELPILMAQLRRTDNELLKEAKRNIRKAEQPAKRAMSQSAAAAGMMKAARAVKPYNRFTGRGALLGLKVDARIAPNARPLDRPNRGNFNRHPVFARRHFGPSLPGSRTAFIGHVSHSGGIDVWVLQPARRFFDRGSEAAFKACEDEMEEALQSVVRYLADG